MRLSFLVASVLACSVFVHSFLLTVPSLANLPPPTDSVSVIDAFWGRPGLKVDAGPGDRSIPLTLVIANTKKDTLLFLFGELLLERVPIKSADGGSRISAYNPAPLRQGEIAYLTFEVNVDPDARPGRYTFNVLLSYQRLNQRGEVESESKFDYVEVYLTEAPGRPELIEFSWSGGQPPELGSVGRLVVSMRLPEPLPIADVVGELRLPASLETPAGSRVAKSVLGRVTGTLITFTFELVSRAAAQSSQVTLSLTYSLEWGTRRSYVYSFEVDLRGSVRLAFEVVPRELVAGSTNQLKLRVINYGTETVYQLLLTISSQPGSQL
ncbi:MAG: hypothetical protein NZ733_04665, partial [Aigarchaeota archaeon]|nr:hypothetical protein [Aigarchaeota archaeon]